MQQQRDSLSVLPGDTAALLDTAREALKEGAWADARSLFEMSLQHEETAEALFGLGSAHWWLGDTLAAIDCLKRAFTAFRHAEDHVRAVFVAIGLYFDYRISLGNSSAARGWLARAARLVKRFQLAPLDGWILLLRAHDSDDPVAAERWATQALELAQRFGDADLELCSLSQIGASLVHLGRIDEGVVMLDEAMAGALAGEGQKPETVVYASCNMIISCVQVAEVERATQWLRVADEFMRRYGSLHLYTLCRTYYGALLFTTGRWLEAEKELTAALRMGRDAERALYGLALAGLAELRLEQGRVDEAAQLLVGFEDDVATTHALGAIHLALQKPAAAVVMLQRRLHEIDGGDRSRVSPYRAGLAVNLEIASLLELLVEAELDRKAVDQATAAAHRLVEFGKSQDCQVISARGARSLGRVFAAAGKDVEAVAHLERALTIFVQLGMPFEIALTHLLLGEGHAKGNHEAATLEGRMALAAFEGLGAERYANKAAAFLRSLGVKAARSGAKGIGVLTKRELDVLALLGEGLSNRELAERLFVTRKTVEHHVASVLDKLALNSRSEAAAYAARRLATSAISASVTPQH